MIHKVFLGLGSNLGDGNKNLRTALQYLNSEVGRIIITSKFLRTEPWGFKSKNSFTNAVTFLQTKLGPIPLLNKTQEIEKKMGRIKKTKPGESYSDRIIDIDILYYDNLKYIDKRLIIPHPLIKQRKFVTIPLNDIKERIILPDEFNNLL